MNPSNYTSTDATGLADEELIRAIAESGSQEALEELYRRHRQILRSVINRVMNSYAETDDVLQEVFIQVWNQAGSFSPDKGLLIGWLVTIARRRALDRMRQMSAYKNATSRYEKAVEPSHPGFLEVSTVEREVSQNELQTLLSQLIAKLPTAQGQVVHLTFFKGLSQREIAAQLAIPLGTIKTRIELGIRKLGRSLIEAKAA